jgi:hypothetical protein
LDKWENGEDIGWFSGSNGVVELVDEEVEEWVEKEAVKQWGLCNGTELLNASRIQLINRKHVAVIGDGWIDEREFGIGKVQDGLQGEVDCVSVKLWFDESWIGQGLVWSGLHWEARVAIDFDCPLHPSPKYIVAGYVVNRTGFSCSWEECGRVWDEISVEKENLEELEAVFDEEVALGQLADFMICSDEGCGAKIIRVESIHGGGS